MWRTLTSTVVLAACVVLVALVYTRVRVVLPPVPQDSASSRPVAGIRTVAVGGQTVRVSVATTDAEREKGLGGRKGLAPDEGMLFVFPKDGAYAFWMKDMLFSIDILWFSADGTIVDMRQNVSPATYPASFSPKSSARYVLELPAGFAQQYTVRPGDIVRL